MTTFSARKLRPTAALASLLLALGPSATVGAQTGPGVEARDDYFEPVYLEVAPGTTVTWRNVGARTHTVTHQTDPGIFDSGNMPPQVGTFSHTFDVPGTYNYYCRLHGTTSPAPDRSLPATDQPCRMCATVVVTGAAPPPQPQPTPGGQPPPPRTPARTPPPAPTPEPPSPDDTEQPLDPLPVPEATPELADETDERDLDAQQAAAPDDEPSDRRGLVTLLALALVVGAGLLVWRMVLLR